MASRFSAVVGVLVLAASGFAGEPVPPVQDPPEISFEVRVLSLSPTILDRARIEFDLKTGSLTDAQLRALLEAVQADRRSNVLQCPKVTTDDGQEMVVSMTEKQRFVTGLEAINVRGETVLAPRETTTETGAKLTILGCVSADGKTIKTRIRYTDTHVDGEVPLIPVTTSVRPIAQSGSKGKPVTFTRYLQVPQFETITIEKKDLAIPSGGHVIIPGPSRTQEVRTECGPPVVSKIPYVNRLFKNVGVARETVQTYLIVSPRLLEESSNPPARR